MDAQRPPRADATAPLGLSVEQVLDAGADPVLVIDGRGRIAYASRRVEAVFGWSPKALLGHRVEVLVPEHLTERHAAHRAAYARHPTPRAMASRLNLTARRRDGTGFPVEVSLTPVASESGPMVIATIVDITTRTGVQDARAQAHVELQRRAENVEHAARELTVFGQLGKLLEACQTLEEAYAVIAGVAEPLFPGDAGAIYALAESRTAAEAVAAWGNPPPVRSVFPPTECWALRRGQLHIVQDGEPELKCPHVDEPVSVGMLCAPVVAQAETLGLLHVQIRHRVSDKARSAALVAHERLLATLAEQVALPLANISLRAALREQSSRDALTGLFNRRYMEESLDREIRRAGREGYSLGILMADLDNFKTLNDSFGHAAGDAVLRRLGQYLLGAVRAEDIACRFGGEEFVIILPKASREDAQLRAEALRTGITAQQADEPMFVYPTATISVGVAAFPEHGTSVDELLLAADSALYRAKAQGRDRVVVAGEPDRRTADTKAG
jgi:diguanylate cyclase (GGDEF)-like protein/PAS domain S-box-containing protein